MNNKNKKGFFSGLFIGGLVGGAVIYLIGTKDGQKKFKKVISKISFFENELEEKIASLKEKAQGLLEETEGIKSKITSEIESNKQTISDNIISKVDDSLTKIEDIQKKGISLTEDVHKRFFKKKGKKLNS